MNSDSVEAILLEFGAKYNSASLTGDIHWKQEAREEAKTALDRHYAQKHAAEVLELIGPDETDGEFELGAAAEFRNELKASLRKAVQEHWGV